MKKNIIISIFAGLAAAFGVLLIMGDNNESTAIKFVSMPKVFAESNLKLEYEKKLNDFEAESNLTLQSFQDSIQLMEIKGVAAQDVNRLRQELNFERNRLSELYQLKSQTFQDSVWALINAEVENFGKEKGYKYILGANGSGNIMYADDSEDITEEVLKWINK